MKSGLVAALFLGACSGGDAAPTDGRTSDASTDAVLSDAPSDVPTDVPTDVASDAPACLLTTACPPAAAGKASLCGEVIDAELIPPAAFPDADGSACDPEQPTATGPCSMRLVVVDALEYSQNPTGSIPLAVGAQSIDTCGRYVLRDVTPPESGFAAIVVDDHPAVANTRVPTMTVVPAGAGITFISTTYTTRVATEQAWSSDAGLTPGFAERGALLVTFGVGEPIAGVRIQRNATDITDDDFYFDDVTLMRTTISGARTETAANGSVLVVGGASIATYSGVGACTWYTPMASTVAGHIRMLTVEQRVCP